MRLRERLVARQRLSGVILKMPCPADVELAGATGFDFVILDTEHGPWNGIELEHHLRAASAAGIPALVRVPGLDRAAIGASLDAGADGVVVPHVTTPEQAGAVVAAARYPPAGRRGMARSTRAGRYGTILPGDHVERAGGTCVILQIEDLEGAEAAREIAAVPGVDGLFPGAVDIAAGLGVADAATDARVQAAVEQVLAAAATSGLAAMVVAGHPLDERRPSAAGATAFVFVGSALVADAFRGAVSTATSDTGPPSKDLLLVPGMLCGPELWEPLLAADSDRWSPQFARIDLDASVVDMARSVLAVAPERFVAAGHSLGGIVLLEILRLEPERVLGAVLVATSARPPTEDQRGAWRRLTDVVQADDFDRIVREQADLLLGAKGAADDHLRAVAETMARHVGAAGFLRQLEAQQARTDLRPSLVDIAVPVLVVSGDEDAVCPPELQEEIAERVPGAIHVRMPGAGHLVPLEAPNELAAALAEWADAR